MCFVPLSQQHTKIIKRYLYNGKEKNEEEKSLPRSRHLGVQISTATAVPSSPVGRLPEKLLGAEVGVAQQPTRSHVSVEARTGALHPARRRVRPRRLVPPQATDLFLLGDGTPDTPSRQKEKT